MCRLLRVGIYCIMQFIYGGNVLHLDKVLVIYLKLQRFTKNLSQIISSLDFASLHVVIFNM